MNKRRMETKELPLEIKADADSGEVEGYGSVFGNIDLGGDIIAAGAFADSIREKAQLPMLWQHNPGDVRGLWTEMSEDDRGLKLKGQVAMDTTGGRDAAALMRMGALKGLSIGYMTRDSSMDEQTGIRTIKQADLWEVSLVTFPMNPEAQVASVKSVDEIDAMTETDVERRLREEFGVPRQEAKAMIHRLKALGAERKAQDLEAVTTSAALDGLLARLRR